MNVEALKKHFQGKGWFILDLPHPQVVFETRSLLEEELFKLLGKRIALEDYHSVIENDQEHNDIQIKITAAFRKAQAGPKILSQQLSFFKEFIGPDVLGQSNPYLRITRPHKPQDNIGYHRDTFYGGSPYELSVLIPFVDVPAESSLSVLSGSHIHPESHYPTTQIENPDTAVRKGSAKHQLGFLYAPKLMDSSVDSLMEAIPLKMGQALIFSLSTVHGSTLNSGKISRWSSDMRVANALTPVDLSARPDYYQPLSYSVVTEAAKQYIKNNEQKTRENVQLELCHTTS